MRAGFLAQHAEIAALAREVGERLLAALAVLLFVDRLPRAGVVGNLDPVVRRVGPLPVQRHLRDVDRLAEVDLQPLGFAAGTATGPARFPDRHRAHTRRVGSGVGGRRRDDRPVLGGRGDFGVKQSCNADGTPL